MTALRNMIEEAKAAIDTVPDDKKISLVNSLMGLTKRLADNVLSFHDVPVRFDEEIYPALTSQLTAAKKRTEKAADDVMTATENIMTALTNIQGDGKDIIQHNVNTLFEACNFQDLVAQHLEIIQELCDEIGEDMADLRASIDTIGGGNDQAAPRERKNREKRPDSHLLNGPVTNFETGKSAHK